MLQLLLYCEKLSLIKNGRAEGGRENDWKHGRTQTDTNKNLVKKGQTTGKRIVLEGPKIHFLGGRCNTLRTNFVGNLRGDSNKALI